MAIFANVNPRISGEGQRLPAKFGTRVEPSGPHFLAKTKRQTYPRKT